MFYLFENWQYRGDSITYTSQTNCETVELNLTEEERNKLFHWYLYIDWQIVTSNECILYEIKKVNQEFDDQINSFLSKYPQREQDTFTEKKLEAERVINWEESVYISYKSEALWISAKEYAQKIIDKSNKFIEIYAKLENEKDLKIIELSKKLES